MTAAEMRAGMQMAAEARGILDEQHSMSVIWSQYLASPVSVPWVRCSSVSVPWEELRPQTMNYRTEPLGDDLTDNVCSSDAP